MAGSVLGGAVAGAIAGGSYTSRDCPTGDPDACLGAAFPGFIWGTGAGTTIGAPVGAWLGSGRRRLLAPPMIASVALFAAEVRPCVPSSTTAAPSTRTPRWPS